MKTLETLIPKLLEKTSDGSLDWTQGDSPSKFQTHIGKHSIDIWEWVSEEDGSEGASLAIKPKGVIPYSDVVYYDKYSSRYEKLQELYSYARRSALKIDHMIIEVEKELDDLLRF